MGDKQTENVQSPRSQHSEITLPIPRDPSSLWVFNAYKLGERCIHFLKNSSSAYRSDEKEVCSDRQQVLTGFRDPALEGYGVSICGTCTCGTRWGGGQEVPTTAFSSWCRPHVKTEHVKPTLVVYPALLNLGGHRTLWPVGQIIESGLGGDAHF